MAWTWPALASAAKYTEALHAAIEQASPDRFPIITGLGSELLSGPAREW